MAARVVHWDLSCPTPHDPDGSDIVYCGTVLTEGYFSGDRQKVTCKRCLRSFAAEEKQRQKRHRELMRSREAWAEECAQ